MIYSAGETFFKKLLDEASEVLPENMKPSDLKSFLNKSDKILQKREYEINGRGTWPSEEKTKRYQNYLLD